METSVNAEHASAARRALQRDDQRGREAMDDRRHDGGAMVPGSRSVGSGQGGRVQLNRQGKARRPAIISRRGLQVALGSLWLLDGALQLQPYMFSKGFSADVLGPAASGQPAFVGSPITWVAGLVAHHPVALNGLFALVQLLIGAGLLLRRTVRPALAASCVWALAVWSLGEGFGMVLTGTASPLTGAPGAVLIYAFIGVLAWPARSAGPAVAVAQAAARVMWFVLWAGSAALWLLPANRAGDAVHDAIKGATANEPGWLAGMLDGAAKASSGHGLAVALVLAAASAAIAVGVFTRRPVLFVSAGIALSLTFWVLGQALGATLTGRATDPNTGPLVLLLGLALMARPWAGPDLADPPPGTTPVDRDQQTYQDLLASVQAAVGPAASR